MNKKILEILIEEKVIDEKMMINALNRQSQVGGKVGGHLLALGYVNPRQLARALSKRFLIPDVEPSVLDQIDAKLINEFPMHLARKYIALPLMKVKNQLSIVISDPSNLDSIRVITAQTGMRIRPFVAPEDIIKKKIVEYYKLDHSFLIPDKSAYKNHATQDEFMIKAYDLDKLDEIDNYIPATETFLSIPEEEKIHSETSNYPLIAAPGDPYVLGLTKVRSMDEFASEITEQLFLGLNRIAVFELYADRLEHIASKNWHSEKGTKSITFKKDGINFYILLQENFFSGPLNMIVSDEMAGFLIQDILPDYSGWHAVAIVLNYLNNPHYFVLGDLNGQIIPDKYQETWKTKQPKFQEALEYLIPSFEIEGTL
jgi:hypothetical protein